MNATQTVQLFVFLLAGFVGFQTISRIPPLLHTPLMAATNAISGISLVASFVLAGSASGGGGDAGERHGRGRPKAPEGHG